MGTDAQKLLAKGLVDLANIVAAALVFGQFISGQGFRTSIFVVGIVLTVALYTAGVAFSKWGRG